MIITVNKILKAKEAYTHAGVFHADDVFGSALLKMINSDIHIIRTFNPPVSDPDAIIFDIGGGRYDHHGSKVYRQFHDGSGDDLDHPYAAFGKLWRDLGSKIMGNSTLAANVDKSLCWDIDATDNYGQAKHPNTLSYAISLFNPEWNATESADECFNKAVDFALNILRQAVKKELSKEEAKNIVLSSEVKNNHILIMDRFVPWKGTIMQKNLETCVTTLTSSDVSQYTLHKDNMIAFGIYPSQRGGWNLETVQSIESTLSSKDTIKTELKKSSDDLIKVSEFCVPLKSEDDVHSSATDFDGCKFLHASGFLSSFNTKEEAIRCAQSLIDEYNVDGDYTFTETREKRSA